MRLLTLTLLTELFLSAILSLNINQANAQANQIVETVVGAISDDAGLPNDMRSCPQDYNSNPDYCLLEMFNVKVNGATKEQKAYIYGLLASTKSEKYRKLLSNGSLLNINVTSTCTTSTAYGDINLNGYFNCGRTDKGKRYLLIHETGHQIMRKNSQLANQFPLSNLKNSDAACYSYEQDQCTPGVQWLQSYILRYYCPQYKGSTSCYNSSISNFRESFAEAVANQLFSDRAEVARYINGCGKAIYNYPTNCSGTHKWIGENIYGSK